MIEVILFILKIIGIVLAVALGLVILALVLVLFAPIRYKIKIIHNPERTEVDGKVTFLFPLLAFYFRYLEKFTYKGRLLWYKFLDSETVKKEKPEKKKSKKKKKQDGQSEKQEETTPVAEERTSPSKKKEAPQQDEVPNQEKTEEKKQGLFEKIRLKIQKVRETIGNIIAKIKRLWHQKEEVQRILRKSESKRAISYTWDKIKRLVCHILPKKIKGYVAYGSSNPATTGQVLGIISVVYAKTGYLLEIRPNFEEEQLECDVELKGRLRVFTVLVIAVKVFMNQELRQLIQELKAIKEIE